MQSALLKNQEDVLIGPDHAKSIRELPGNTTTLRLKVGSEVNPYFAFILLIL